MKKPGTFVPLKQLQDGHCPIFEPGLAFLDSMVIGSTIAVGTLWRENRNIHTAVISPRSELPYDRHSEKQTTRRGAGA